MNGRLLGIGLIALADIAYAGAPSDGFHKLSLKSCKPVGSSEFADKLPPDWSPYLSATKVCPLLPTHKTKSHIVLISIFATDYYRDKPADAPWANFPKPILVNRDGAYVARLPELFPFDEPRELSLRYGRWQGDTPGEIRVHVRNPPIGWRLRFAGIDMESWASSILAAVLYL